MRGQKLFVRPIENDDQAAIRAFLTRESPRPAEPPTFGLLGKVVGELTVVLGATVGDDALRIDELVVSGHLRRKRIGRFMLTQLDSLAAELNRPWLVVEPDENSRVFFERSGFERDGSTMRRRVEGSSGGRG